MTINIMMSYYINIHTHMICMYNVMYVCLSLSLSISLSLYIYIYTCMCIYRYVYLYVLATALITRLPESTPGTRPLALASMVIYIVFFLRDQSEQQWSKQRV